MLLITFLLSFIFAFLDVTQSFLHEEREGITLGTFVFSSNGGNVFRIYDRSPLSDSTAEGNEVVPYGAVLTGINHNTWTGFYDGKMHYKKFDDTISLNKVFFKINKYSGIRFYAPDVDNNKLPGNRINEQIIFED